MRWPNPGDSLRRRHGLQDEQRWNSRIHVGQVVHVDEEAGTVDVHISGLSEIVRCVIALGGISVQGAHSSWMRYMPQVHDFVKVGFGPDNVPECLGAATWGHKVTTTSRSRGLNRDGYLAVSTAAEDRPAGLGPFRVLEQGEWDMRSSGGAYIWGSRAGTLLLSAGPIATEVDREAREVRSTTPHTRITDDGCDLRFGDVKRTVPPDFAPRTVASNPTGAAAPKEWRVEVGKATPVGAYLTFYRDEGGDIRDSLGLPELHSQSEFPLRYRKTTYDPTGLFETFTFEVDTAGNVNMEQVATALPSGFRIKGTQVKIESHIPTTLPAIYVGSNATDPYLLTTVWTPARATMNTAIIAAHSAHATELAGLLTVLSTFFTPFFAAYAADNALDPLTKPSAATAALWPGVLAAYTALEATAALNAGAAATAVGTFEAGSLTYLSKHVFGT